MINPDAIAERMITAIRQLPDYLGVMRHENGKVYIQHTKEYIIDLTNVTCTCQDFLYRGTPCKHIFMAVIFVNGKNQDQNP